MTKWTKASPSGVRWPEEWDEGEGWASPQGKETGLNKEPRHWNTLASDWLAKKSGLRADSLVESLGGPVGWNLSRTLEQCRDDILRYYKRTGVAPTSRSSNEFFRWGGWLRRQGSTLRRECNLLNLPTVRNNNKDLGQCHARLKGYFDEVGSRPNAATSSEFRNWDMWLRNRGSTLSRECDQLGLPVVRRRDRTVEECHEEILTHYKETGKRPTQTDYSRFNNWVSWLRRQGSSLSKECDKLGL